MSLESIDFLCIEQFEYTNGKLVVGGWFIDNKHRKLIGISYSTKNYEKEFEVEKRFRRDDLTEYAVDCEPLFGFRIEWNAVFMPKGQIYLVYEEEGEKKIRYLGVKGDGLRDRIAYYIEKAKDKSFSDLLSYLNIFKLFRVLKKSYLPVSSDYADNFDLWKYTNSNVTEYVPCLYDEVIDVVVPIYNGFKYLEKLFEGIYKSKTPFRLIVVDDCSTDEKVKSFLQSLSHEKDNVVLISNERNLGFLKSVNKALDVSDADVAIVNTDVELPEFWLERLMYPIVNDQKVASSTPFTNSGTICSFPHFLQDNKLFGNLGVNDIDEVFRAIVPGSYTIPTGVGFCMGMSRKAINEIGGFDEEFGRGYGEENDWCRRAAKAGYNNVHVNNLFVYHNHGGSFPSEEKKRLLKEHEKILLRKHPEYKAEVAKYCETDPAKKDRKYAFFKLLFKLDTDKIIVFSHNLGGGAHSHIQNAEKEWNTENKAVIHIAYDVYSSVYIINCKYQDIEVEYFVLNFDQLCGLIDNNRVDKVIVNELVSYPNVYETLRYISDYCSRHDSELVMFAHDYFLICPNVNLFNEEKRYCEINGCSSCNLDKCNLGCNIYESIDKWRKEWGAFLSNCNSVVVFSKDSENKIKSIYPDLNNILLRPHSVGYMPKLNKHVRRSKTTIIGVLGILTYHKGSEQIRKLIDYADENEVDLKVVLIGELESDVKPITSDRFMQTGRYQVGEIPKLVFGLDIQCFFIASVCPETFSYTTQEIIEMDMPIVVYDIGAPAERVREYKKGVVISVNSTPKELLTAVYDLIEKENTVVVNENKRELFIKEYDSFTSRYRIEHRREEKLFDGILSDVIDINNKEEIDSCIENNYSRVIVYRCKYSRELEKIVNHFKSKGADVVYDIDDLLFDYSSIKDISFFKTQEYHGIKRICELNCKCMSLADSITTSTINLRDQIIRLFPKKEVEVIRNDASLEMYVYSMIAQREKRDEDKIVLVYFSGSNTHNGDFAIIENLLLKLMGEFEKLILLLAGCIEIADGFQAYNNRIIRQGFTDWKNLPGIIHKADINLMPLESGIFNECKSENKWMEAALVRVPTIASYNSELDRCITDGYDGILCRTEKEWERGLRELICNKEYRVGIGEKAYNKCKNSKLTIVYNERDLGK